MSLNLHGIVRGAIQAVNADIPALWLRSTGYTVVGGEQIPSYAPPVRVMCQVQPPSGKGLQHMDYMNVQGTTRTVYMYGAPSAISRVDAKGGDLLQFPQVPGGPVENWKIVQEDEQGWALNGGGWSKVLVELQVDRPQ